MNVYELKTINYNKSVDQIDTLAVSIGYMNTKRNRVNYLSFQRELVLGSEQLKSQQWSPLSFLLFENFQKQQLVIKIKSKLKGQQSFLPIVEPVSLDIPLGIAVYGNTWRIQISFKKQEPQHNFVQIHNLNFSFSKFPLFFQLEVPSMGVAQIFEEDTFVFPIGAQQQLEFRVCAAVKNAAVVLHTAQFNVGKLQESSGVGQFFRFAVDKIAVSEQFHVLFQFLEFMTNDKLLQKLSEKERTSVTNMWSDLVKTRCISEQLFQEILVADMKDWKYISKCTSHIEKKSKAGIFPFQRAPETIENCQAEFVVSFIGGLNLNTYLQNPAQSFLNNSSQYLQNVKHINANYVQAINAKQLLAENTFAVLSVFSQQNVDGVMRVTICKQDQVPDANILSFKNNDPVSFSNEANQCFANIIGINKYQTNTITLPFSQPQHLKLSKQNTNSTQLQQSDDQLTLYFKQIWEASFQKDLVISFCIDNPSYISGKVQIPLDYLLLQFKLPTSPLQNEIAFDISIFDIGYVIVITQCGIMQYLDIPQQAIVNQQNQQQLTQQFEEAKSDKNMFDQFKSFQQQPVNSFLQSDLVTQIEAQTSKLDLSDKQYVAQQKYENIQDNGSQIQQLRKLLQQSELNLQTINKQKIQLQHQISAIDCISQQLPNELVDSETLKFYNIYFQTNLSQIVTSKVQMFNQLIEQIPKTMLYDNLIDLFKVYTQKQNEVIHQKEIINGASYKQMLQYEEMIENMEEQLVVMMSKIQGGQKVKKLLSNSGYTEKISSVLMSKIIEE